ncbi:hypothetical protein JZ785_03155 [Alicyclobacillus curvatus]|nr:hypothetical protein JZ785_03155 [Alicyclobacillus curvatus]
MNQYKECVKVARPNWIGLQKGEIRRSIGLGAFIAFLVSPLGAIMGVISISRRVCVDWCASPDAMDWF